MAAEEYGTRGTTRGPVTLKMGQILVSFTTGRKTNPQLLAMFSSVISLQLLAFSPAASSSSCGMAEVSHSVTSDLLSRHEDLYSFATRHPFILSVRNGSVTNASFKRWLGQEYLFVRALVRFGASVLLKTPQNEKDSDMDVILGGLASLATELEWFRKEAVKWDVDLETLTPHSTTEEYIQLLQDLSKDEVDYAVAVAAFWAIDVVYSDSFQVCVQPDANVHSDFLSACERWGSQEFRSYVQSVQVLADRNLEHARSHVKRKAEDFFVQIVTQKVSFWNMSQDDSE